MTVTLEGRINQLVDQYGSLRAVSRATGIEAGYLSRLRSGQKLNPEQQTLRRLGLECVVEYRLIEQ